MPKTKTNIIFNTVIVCHCRRVNHHRVLEVVNQGAASVEAVGEACGAGTACGGCHASIEALLQGGAAREEGDAARPAAAGACRAA